MQELIHFPRNLLMDCSSRFLVVCPSASLLLHRSKLADLLINVHQLLAEFLKTMKLGDFLLRFSKGSRVGERFGHGLSCLPAGESELGIMARVVRFGAMARWFPAASHNGGDRTGSQVA